MRMGVLGGTFDPPHLGHTALASAARQQLRLDRVIFIPAGEPYRKAAREVTPASVRLALVRAATEGLPWADVSAVEVERPGPTYSDETLAQLARDGGEWWFIVGADVLADLPYWRNPLRLLKVARLAVAVRPPAPRLVPPDTLRALPGIEERVDWIEMKPLDVSSTEIRRRLNSGQPTDSWLSPAVRGLIDQLGLYRAARASGAD